MANISLLKPPDPFSCSICSEPPFNKKGSAQVEGCASCPAFKDTHYFPYHSGDSMPDLIVLGDVPEAPKMSFINGVRQWKHTYHDAFEEDGAKVIKLAIKKIKEENKHYSGLAVKYLYAVKCSTDSIKKSIIASCNIFLKNEIHKIIDNHHKLGSPTNLVILACGTHSLTALGVPVKSENEAMGRIFDCTFMGYNFKVVFTRSISAWAASSGKFSSLKADVTRALELVRSNVIKVKPRVEIEAKYVYPKSIEEVTNLVDEIINYSNGVVEPQKWAISSDTETNTLYPYKDGLKCIAFSSAWDDGKSTTIPLWHKNNKYSPEEAWEHVKRLLLSGKPTIWHNGKYDYKVLWKLGLPMNFIANTAWDSLLAEHILEEDKKGQYSLKFLVKQFFPEMSGYEDKLHDFLEKHDDSFTEKEKKKIIEIPEIIKAALEDLSLKATFSVKALEKKLNLLEAEDPNAKLMRLVINAKKNGEFKTQEQVLKEKAKKPGGFEEIPLDELCFYAAVDADATRRLALLQNKRMIIEQHDVIKKREVIKKKLQFLPPSMQKYKVDVLCEDPNPSRTLLVRDYLPRQHALSKVEYQGVRIDRDYIQTGIKQLENTILTTEQQIFKLCGESFKVNSSKVLSGFLFKSGVGYTHPDPALAEEMVKSHPDEVIYKNGKIMYKAPRYTKRGAEQTNEAALKHLVAKYQCPLANLILSYRKAFKAKNSFFVNIEKLSREDGFIHPNYNLNGTATGRLSSNSGVRKIGFNNQNIIKGLIGALKDARGNFILGEDGKPLFEGVSCKKLFIPDDNSYAFFNADAKGAEVSVFSAFSKDAQLIKALIDGMDAHSFFGSKCLNPNVVAAGLTGDARKVALNKAGIDDEHGWTYEDFLLGKDDKLEDKAYGKRLKKLRDNIKRLVFGLLYGAGVKKIAEIAGINLELAETIHKLLFSMFSTIPDFIEQTKWELRTFGFVETYDGRKRRFSLGEGAPASLKARAERQGVNFKIQGQNSDIVMKVLVWFTEILERDFGGRLLLTVHDSLGFQVPKKYIEQIPEVIYEVGTKKVAKEHPWMPVPYRWDVECGDNYGDVMDPKKYVSNLKKDYEAQLEGYTVEEQYDDIRKYYDAMDGVRK